MLTFIKLWKESSFSTSCIFSTKCVRISSSYYIGFLLRRALQKNLSLTEMIFLTENTFVKIYHPEFLSKSCEKSIQAPIETINPKQHKDQFFSSRFELLIFTGHCNSKVDQTDHIE